MKVVLLTSSGLGTAAHHLPYLLEAQGIEVTMVVLCRGQVTDKRRFFQRKARKLLEIGVLGAWAGFRMRRWFGEDLQALLGTKDLESTCRDHAIPFYSVDTINSKETRELFARSGAELGLSLGNGYIGKKVFSIPSRGMLNLHHELLPEFRNAQSVIWQIHAGSSHTGYTIHKIDERIDTGKVLYRETVPIHFKKRFPDTVTHTFAELLAASAKGLVHVLQHFEELETKAVAQGEGRSRTTPNFAQYVRMLRNHRRLRDADRKAKDVS